MPKLMQTFSASFMLALFCSPMAVAQIDLRPEQRAYNHSGWNFVGSMSITFGGDELIEVEVENDFFGDENEDIKAGESAAFALGGAYQFYDVPLQLQATIGYHTDGIFADNGDVDFSRKPLELLAFYSVNKHRFGAGITHHFDPEFEVDFDFQRPYGVDFKDATGFVLQYDYRVASFLALGARLVNIDYEPENRFRGPDVEGDHVGLLITFLF